MQQLRGDGRGDKEQPLRRRAGDPLLAWARDEHLLAFGRMQAGFNRLKEELGTLILYLTGDTELEAEPDLWSPDQNDIDRAEHLIHLRTTDPETLTEVLEVLSEVKEAACYYRDNAENVGCDGDEGFGRCCPAPETMDQITRLLLEAAADVIRVRRWIIDGRLVLTSPPPPWH